MTLSVEIRDFLAAQLAPREWIIRHLIQEKDIAMIYARRGVGKTFAAQALAWTVVTGSECEGAKQERARQMFEEGLRPTDILEELDVSRATAFRWQKQWRTDSA